MAALNLALLGPFTAALDGESLTSFRTTRVQALLVFLACQPESPHTRDLLADLLWPGMPQKSARDNLRQTLYQLRKLIPRLPAKTGQHDVPYVLADRQSVQVNPEASYQLDVLAFEALVEDKPAEAIALYRGDFLMDFFLPDSAPFEEWAQARRSHLRRRYLEALEKLAQQELGIGQLEKAVHYARKQLDVEPLSEVAHRQLMEALARHGRRGEALAHFERMRALFDQELAIEPSSETRLLVQAIERDALELVGRGAHAASALAPEQQIAPPAGAAVRHNLPAESTRFLGREKELEAISGWISSAESRLLTIIGVGGLGKSTLALATARYSIERFPERFPDGVYFVPLAALNSSELISSAIANAMGIRLDRGDQQLMARLKEKQMLLVLDNFEHLLDGNGLIAQMLSAATGIKVLVTSRERLRLKEEQVLVLQRLEVPGDASEGLMSFTSMQLFQQSAQKARIDFELQQGEERTAARICTLLDGLPLAIELAASWIGYLTLAEIEAEIRHSLDFLEGQFRNVPERHRSIRAVFDSSWEQMDHSQQTLFARLAVFKGGFTREAAEAICDASLRDLVSLANKSLIRFEANAGRYGIHELLRQYGLGKLLGDPDDEYTVRARHSNYYCDWFTEQLEPQVLLVRSQKVVLHAIGNEMDNLRDAWLWIARNAHYGLLNLILIKIVRFTVWRGALEGEGLPIAHALLEAVEMSDSDRNIDKEIARVRLLDFIAELHGVLGRNAASKAAVDKLERIITAIESHALDLRWEKAMALVQKGYFHRNEPAEWIRMTSQALSLFRELEDHYGQAYASKALARAYRNQGDVRKARNLAEQSLVIDKRIGDLLGSLETLSVLASIKSLEGFLDEAEQAFRDCLEIGEQLGHFDRVGNAHFWLSTISLLKGRFQDGLAHAQKSIGIYLSNGAITWPAGVRVVLCWLQLHLGNYGACVENVYTLREIGASHGEIFTASADNVLAHIRLASHDYPAALQLTNRSAHRLTASWFVRDVTGPLVLALSHLGIIDMVGVKVGLKLAAERTRGVHGTHLGSQLLLGAACLRVEQGQPEQGLAYYALGRLDPFVGRSVWWRDVTSPWMEKARTALSADSANHAEALGRGLDYQETVTALLEEFTNP